MIRGLYTGASGMVAQQHRLDAISNNLANVDLNGYKRDVSIHKAFPDDDGVVGIGDVQRLAGTLGFANGPSGLDPEFKISGVPADGGNGLNCP